MISGFFAPFYHILASGSLVKIITTYVRHYERLDNVASINRIVYLANQLGIGLPTLDALIESFTSGYSLLNLRQPETGSTNSKYRLRINVKAAMLEPEAS